VTWWIPAAIVAGLLLLAGVVAGAVRRRRFVVVGRLAPDEKVVRAWEHALGSLRRTGLARREQETPSEYVARVRTAERTSAQSMEADAVANLAVLVEQACYTPRPCTPGQAAEARTLASTIAAANRSHGRRARPHAIAD
jgi:hypothetical protein